jgi:hypothetical protein
MRYAIAVVQAASAGGAGVEACPVGSGLEIAIVA